jgi:hypothetical protein
LFWNSALQSAEKLDFALAAARSTSFSAICLAAEGTALDQELLFPQPVLGADVNR